MLENGPRLRGPTMVACSTCRRAKMKCIIVAGKTQCNRCSKGGVACIFEPHKRGQWRRDATAQRPRHYSAANITSAAHPAHSSAATTWIPDTTSQSGTESTFNQTTEDDLPRQTAHVGGPHPSFLLPTFVHENADTRRLSLHVALDPDAGPLSHEPTDSSEESCRFELTCLADDPIEKAILNTPVAQNLFDCFITHFNYLVGVLDPDLFTFQYTRATSPFLFTVVICISSRIFRPEIYHSLRQHSETLLGKALLACDPSIGNIWAIVCMYYWKEVHDTRGYNLVGFALRMASSASWHNDWQHAFTVRQAGLNENELETRCRRDRERAYMVLGNLDRSSSYFTNRPQSALRITGGAASREWLLLDRWSYQNGDSTAIAGNELNEICRPVYEFIIRTKQSETEDCVSHARGEIWRANLEQLTALIHVLNADVTLWGETWGPIYAKYSQPQPCLEQLVYHYQEHVCLYFNSILLHRILVAKRYTCHDLPAATVTEICYSSAMRLLQATLRIAKAGVLYYLWDTAHLMIAFSAMMLLKMFHLTEHATRDAMPLTVELFTELSNEYIRASNSLVPSPSTEVSEEAKMSPAKNLLEAQARLLRSILDKMTSSSTVPSQGANESDELQSPLSETDQPVWQSAADWSISNGHEKDPQDPLPSIFSPSDDEINTLQDVGFDLINFRFEEAGLLLWDENRIFSRSL